MAASAGSVLAPGTANTPSASRKPAFSETASFTARPPQPEWSEEERSARRVGAFSASLSGVAIFGADTDTTDRQREETVGFLRHLALQRGIRSLSTPEVAPTHLSCGGKRAKERDLRF